MAPRPAAASRSAAARGCHAVRSQLSGTSSTTTATRSVSASAASRPLASPPPSPIWISDTLLARAFSRFSRVSHAGRTASATTTGNCRPVHVRLSSSVPGPLEARRRLGKRQMTEQLGLAQHPLPPLPYPFLTAATGENDGASGGWGTPLSPSSASAYSLDPRLWQWAPPRDPTRRPADEQTQQSQQTHTQRQPRPWLARMVGALGEQTAVPQNELANVLPQPPQPPRRLSQAPAPLHRSAAARVFFDDLDAWRRHSTIAYTTSPSFAQSLETICRALETQLRLAALTADDADEALGLLWAGLVQASTVSASPSSESFLRTHAPVLFTAVLRGVSACRLLPAAAAAADLGAPFWRRLLEGVCTLSDPVGTSADCSVTDVEDRAALARLAADILAATPPALLARDLSDLVPAVLEVVFSTTAVDETRIAAIATALQDVVVVGAEEQDINSNDNDIVAATTLRLLQNWTARQQQQQGPSPTPPQAHEAMELHAWLRTLAHMPQVRQECLFATLVQVQERVQAVNVAPGADCTADDSTAPLPFSHAFLCDLLLAQWASRSYIPQSDVLLVYQQTMRENDGAPSVALAALALAVYRTPACRPRCVALYVSLLTCLRRLGRGEAELVASVETLMEAAARRQDITSTASAPPLPLPFLEALAWAADDLPTALQLHALYAVHARRRARAHRTDPRLRFLRAMAATDDGDHHEPRARRRRRDDRWPLWRLAFWNKFADRLGAELDGGALTPGQVSFALDLGERWRGVDRPRTNGNKDKVKTLGEPTVALLERLAMHYALAPELVPRRALRGVEQCRAVLLQHAGAGDEQASTLDASVEPGSPSTVPSPTILRAIFHLITRDLDEAQPGRTSRLRWYVALVQREHSAAAAKVSAHALERWRTAAKRVEQKQS